MKNKLNEIFKVISFYDNFRWSDSRNYNLINFFKDDLDADTKILTHWLCYIADRQMPFQIIWDVGGFVFSDMIKEIKKSKNLNSLDPSNSKPFIKKDNDDNNNIKFHFFSRNHATPIISERYQKNINGNCVIFKSRFLPSDYFSILYTFAILSDYDYSFSKFIKDVCYKYSDEEDIIVKILFSLYLLTYDQNNQPKSKQLINFGENLEKAENRKNGIVKILGDKKLYKEKYTEFCKNMIFKQKRATCSLRDFIKSPEFCQYFKLALLNVGFSDESIKRIVSIDSCKQLELPGDVWNNNSIFRNCILKGTSFQDSRKSLNKILREHYENNKDEIVGYPEQFDITFDFVQRMCLKNNCSICPISNLTEINDFSKVCINDPKKYCPVALISCNYKKNCVGKKDCLLN